jgi:hypothetical protein
MSVQDYLEPAVKDFANQAKATYSAQLDPQTFMGKQYVAGEDPLQTQAINLAQQGVGSYAPYLQSANKHNKIFKTNKTYSVCNKDCSGNRELCQQHNKV